MSDFLGGAAALGYVIAAGFFLRFWQRTRDRLFLAFAVAFTLFALNQGLVQILRVVYEPYSLVYALRVLGFVLIAWAILDKNFLEK